MPFWKVLQLNLVHGSCRLRKKVTEASWIDLLLNISPGKIVSLPLLFQVTLIKTTFLDTIIYKGDRFRNDSILDIRTHYKPTETFQNTHFTLCHPPGVKRGFIKGEALRLLRTNSSQTMFEDNLSNLNCALSSADTLKNLYEEHCQNSILQQDSRLSYERTKRVNESWILSHTNRQCGT